MIILIKNLKITRPNDWRSVGREIQNYGVKNFYKKFFTK